MNKEITHVDHFAGTREQTDLYHISDKATKPNAKYGSDRWTLYANGKEQEVHMGDWLIKDTLGATYIIPDEEMSASLNHTTGGECPYCHLRDSWSRSTKKVLYHEMGIDETVRALNFNIFRQDDGMNLTMSIVTPECCYQRSTPINYCPMCGRYLAGNNDKD